MDGWQSRPLAILLVEKTETCATGLSRRLSRAAGAVIRVERAEGLGAACERLQQHGVDAVLVDLAIVEETGDDGFSKLLESGSAVPVIAIDVSTDAERARSVLRLGADDYLARSECLGSTLLSAIGKAIERKGRLRTLADQLVTLRRRNDELDKFAHLVAHEVKSPLIGITACLDRILDKYADQLDEVTRQFLADSQDAINSIAEVVRDLLELVRLETRDKKFATVNLEAVFYQACAGVRSLVKESGAIITHDPLPTIWGDETQMRVLFQNLLSNAIKYCGEATPLVKVGVGELAATWIVSVRDNGQGIDAVDHERIFEMFERLKVPSPTPGSGIGLTLCRLIARNHGGAIWVKSRLGEGAEFFVSIPKCRSTQCDSAQDR